MKAYQTVPRDIDQTYQGICYLVLGLSIFSLQDVIMKLFSDALALQQIIFFRGMVTLLIIGLLLFRQSGFGGFRTGRPVICLLRGVAGFVCFSTFSMALAVLPLADAMPLYYTAPLFVILFSMMMLREKIRLGSILAIFLGFAGVLFVARPSTGGLDPAMILALISALAYSAQSLLARYLGPTESAKGMTFYSMISFILLSGLTGLLFGSGWLDQFSHPSAQYLFRAWSIPNLEQWLLILAVGIIAAAGFLCISQAYRLGRASDIAPFEYSSLPFAVLWGWLIWNDIPSSLTLVGSGLIIAGGICALRLKR